MQPVIKLSPKLLLVEAHALHTALCFRNLGDDKSRSELLETRHSNLRQKHSILFARPRFNGGTVESTNSGN